MSSVLKADKSNKLPLGIDAWKLLSNENIELIQLKLKPFETLEKHINPQDVIFFVLCGSGRLLIEDDIFKLHPGECIEVKKGLRRSWLNEDNEELNLLVIKMS